MKIEAHQLEFQHPVSCYNGCYDSKSQRVIDEQARVLKLIKMKEPDAIVTYFPMEGQFVVHVYSRELSGYHSSRGAALADAYNRMLP